MSETPRHSVSVTAVVVAPDGNVLMIKRSDDGRWVPPGGVMELGETPQECAAREVLEETGYRIEVGPLTGVYKNMRLGVVSLAFRCAVTGGAARTSAETAAVVWWSPGQVTRDAPEARAIRVLDALRRDGVAVRVHDGERLLDGESIHA